VHLYRPTLHARYLASSGNTRTKLKRRLLNDIKHALQNRQCSNTVCPYCNIPIQRVKNINGNSNVKPATVDHVHSEKFGGKYNDLDNVVFACVDCNHAKGELSPLDFIMRMDR
jgi:5-methylcytosine-specific restriction endonuclease McrA